VHLRRGSAKVRRPYFSIAKEAAKAAGRGEGAAKGQGVNIGLPV